MKYKIWDRINKRHDSCKYMDSDGLMCDLAFTSFDRDDFEVQWTMEVGDDLVDFTGWENHENKKILKEEIANLLTAISSSKNILQKI